MTIAEFNYIEAGLWFIIAIVLMITILMKGSSSTYQRLSIVTSITLIIFGVSDLIEAQTGAWWQPISLLVLKAGCIIILVCCYFKYRQLKY